MSRLWKNTFFRRTVKTLGWTIGILFLLVTVLAAALQFSQVQNYITQKAIVPLSEKTHTRIELGSVTVSFPNSVVLHHLFLEDEHHDTLLYVGTLQAEVNLFGLITRTIHVSSIRIDSLSARITRSSPDSVFNFDFLSAALNSGQSVKPASPDTAVSGWSIGLYELSLHSINVSYIDDITGTDARIILDRCDIALDKSDITTKQFHVSHFRLANTWIDLKQSKESTPDTTHSPPPDIGLKTASLANIHLRYENTIAGARYHADLGEASITAEAIDLRENRIALKEILLKNSSVAIEQPASIPDSSAGLASTGTPWTIGLEKADISLKTVEFAIIGAKRLPGFDPSHLSMHNVDVSAENLFFSPNRGSVDVKHVSFSEQSGLTVKNLSFYAAADSLHMQLSDFLLETPSTTLRQDVLVTYASPAALKSRPGNARVNISVDDSHIGISDILLFNPTLPIKHSDRAVDIALGLSGLIRDLRIDECRISTGDSTALDLVGSVIGLPDAKKASYDVTVRKLSSGRADLHRLVVDTLLPKQIEIPASLVLTGSFKGTTNDFDASGDLWTSIGTIGLSAALTHGRISSTAKWKTNIKMSNVDLGALMKDSSTFGPLSMTANANGSGMKKEDLNAFVEVDVDKVVLLGYPYRNLTVAGTAGAEMFDGSIALNDSNIVFQYDGRIDISKEHPAYEFTFDLKGADLRRLKFSNDDLRVSATVVTSLKGSTMNDVNGHVDIRNVMVVKNRRRFMIDSMMYASVNKKAETHISLESPVFGAKFDGTIALGALPGELKKHFGRYFTIHDSSTTAPADTQSFTFSLELRDPETITQVFFPSLTRLDAGIIEGSYHSLKNDLSVNANLNSLTYSGVTIDTLRFTASSDARRMKTGIHAGSIADSQFVVTDLDADAIVAHDSIDVSVRSQDENGGTKMLLAGIINSINNGYRFRFKPDGIVFHDSKWMITPDHSIEFGKDRFIAHHVVISDTGYSIALQSTDETSPHSPLKLEIKKFDLSTISQIAERDSGYLGGTVDGTVQINDLSKAFAFSSDLAIHDLTFGRHPIGDLSLKADNQMANVYALSLQLTGNGNHVTVDGAMAVHDSISTLNFAVTPGPLNLSSLEPLTFGAVTRLSGTMTGRIQITGTILKPVLTGELQFADVGFNPSALGAYLRLTGGSIGFDSRGIGFRSLNFTDTVGGTAAVNGLLTTTDYQSFGFDMAVETNRFLLMNKAPEPKALYYGTVFLNSNIRVKGIQTHPIVDMNARLGKGTALTFVVPEDDATVQDQRGIVRFIDRKNPGNPIMTRPMAARRPRDSTRSRFSTIDLTSNIEVTKDTKLRIFVDPVSGDSLIVQGDATFSLGMDPSGKLSITGQYEISDGSYQVSLNQLIKKDFKIQKGSSMTWFGTPFDANVDLTAIYTVKTSPLDLVQDEIAGMSQEERTKYKQELPVMVYLQMRGSLLKPDISFRIDLADEQRGAMGGAVYAKLTQVNEQESELNKQVFALLVLGRFISSDPLAMVDEGSGFSGLARSSVSRLLTSQLNNLSQRYVKGVDLNVGVESGQDYSTGTAENRTQLQVALSKSLFDERVTVQIGGNVDLEGPRSQQNSLNNFAGDVKVGYKLTEDGRWQMQVFRQTAYEGMLEGDLIETGVGLVFTIDYDKLVGFTLKPVRDTDEEAK